MSKTKFNNRSDFSPKVKRILAERVGFRCSFPNCNRITIGPNSTIDNKSIMLGEAAHINAASNGGPRPLPELTEKQRSSYENGIWLCKQHARLIDVDYEIYSAETLRNWKAAAEANAYRLLRDLEKSDVDSPTTLVCLDVDLMFEGFWKSAINDSWIIVVKKYVFGSEQRLREFADNNGSNAMLNYIIIESQGDGRLIKERIRWEMNIDNQMEIQVRVLPKYDRKNPDDIGSDVATGPDGDIVIENGDFKKVFGKELAKQVIERNLSWPIGSWVANPLLGSFFSMYYNQYEDDPEFLNRIIKIEITRLIHIPVYQSGTRAEEPELNFIKRIIDVKVGKEINKIVPLFLSLEWGDNTTWSGVLNVRIVDIRSDDTFYQVPDFVKKIFETKPIKKFEKLIKNLNREPMKEGISEQFVYQVFNEIIPAIIAQIEDILKAEIFCCFNDHNITRSINGQIFDYSTIIGLEKMYYHGTIHEVGANIKLLGFKNMGVDAFDTYHELHFYFNTYNYEIGKSKNDIWHTRLYHQILSLEDVNTIAEEWFNTIVKYINERIEWFEKNGTQNK